MPEYPFKLLLCILERAGAFFAMVVHRHGVFPMDDGVTYRFPFLGSFGFPGKYRTFSVSEGQ